ncbi:MAG TPA: PKD domain-containing protein [Marmoricola sp.]|nr:PKD domain-containing protein [Marmoricola sp.]
MNDSTSAVHRSAGPRRKRRHAVLAVAGMILAPLGLAVGPTTGAAAAQVAPGHDSLVPDEPRTDTPLISDGEIWDIEVVGNRVFIAGSFTSIANRSGATIAQSSLAAYDINTGLVDTSFRPAFGGGGVSAVEASPDGSALYVAGTFRTVNGVNKQRIARLDLTTGAPVARFTANTGLAATALAVSDTAVYVGGKFAKVGGVDRSALAALDPTTGNVDPEFDLPLSGGIGVDGVLSVDQLRLTHDGSTLLVLHSGRQIDGQDRYGVGLIDTDTKSLLPWHSRIWEQNLAFVGGIQRAYAVDIAPDDSYFVVTSGSGGDRPPINDTAISFPLEGGDDVQPNWISRHFDSVYSVAITEEAVYVGGHFSWQESPTAPVPWPGLDNVGYGNGQGLSGYGLGDAVVRRDHIGALDPATGTALEWNPGANAYEGIKTLEATPRGLFAGGDGMIQGGRRVGRVGFFDLDTAPAPSAVDTTITAPIQGRVVAADEPYTIEGRASAPTAITRVQVRLQDRGTKQWLQDDLVTWGAANTIDAELGAGSTSRSWSLDVTLTGNNEYEVFAKAYASGGTSDPVQPSKKFESFGLADATPTTSISSPSSGLVPTKSFVATGTASDDVGVAAMTYWFRDGNGSYLQNDGTVAPVYNSFRGEPDVVGAPSATWQYEVTLPTEGAWTMGAFAVDTAGQSDLRAASRDWIISEDAVPPTVSITAPVASAVVEPGLPLTFSGTAAAEGNLATVEVSLRNTTTRESLASDGSWGKDSIASYYRISPRSIGAPTYDWSYTTPFDLSAGVYDFRVRAIDTTGVSTSFSQGRISVTAQYADDAFPNGVLDFTGTEQNIEELHLDVTGTATDDRGVEAVGIALRDLDTNRYVQPDGRLAPGFATLDATLGSPGATSTTFSLPVDLLEKGEYNVEAYAVDTAGQQDASTSGATARYLVYPGDADPTLSETLSQPVEGAEFTESRIVVSGRALDDLALSRVDVAVVNSAGMYMSSSGAFTSTTESYRSAFLNSPGTPGSNYSYTSPVLPDGSYTVKVRAVDGWGQLQQTPKSVNVTVSAPAGNAAPVAAMTASCVANVCSFDGRGSTDESPTTLSYAWEFGNGRTGSGPVPSHTYTTPGTFAVKLTVRDLYGASGTVTSEVVVTEPAANRAPTAVMADPACAEATCGFSAAGTTDPNAGDVVTYSWDFGDGTPAGTGSAPSHTYAAGGTYTVTLTASDGWGRSSTTRRDVTIEGAAPANRAPTASFTASCSELGCTFDGSGSSDPDAGDAVASYTWDFGDGTAPGAGAKPAHTYGAAGTYTVKLVVRDNGGLTGQSVQQVVVEAPPASQSIAFRAGANRTGNVSRPSVTIPSSVVAGDTMVLYLSINRSTAVTNPAGWTVVGSRNGDRDQLQTRVWTKVATEADAGSVIRTPLGATAKYALSVAAYSGVDPSAPVAGVASSSETTSRAAHTTPEVTGEEPGSWLLSYWTDKSSTTTDWRPPAGQNVRGELIGVGTGRVNALLTDSQGGDGGLTATASSASRKAVMWSLILNPAS